MSANSEQLLSSVKPSQAIVRLAIPATAALLAKAVYNIVDTAYIGMLGSDTALAAVGVTLPLLLKVVLSVSLNTCLPTRLVLCSAVRSSTSLFEVVCRLSRLSSDWTMLSCDNWVTYSLESCGSVGS